MRHRKTNLYIWAAFILVFVLVKAFVVTTNLEKLVLSFVLSSGIVYLVFIPYITKKPMYVPPLENELIHGKSNILRAIFLFNGLVLFLVCLFI
jgi:hypothetical protein